MALSDFVKSFVNLSANVGFPSVLNAEQIMDKKFNKLPHIVPGVIPQGLTLLVASPKMGKSFLCLEIALAVASGGKVLGIDVEAHEVLYLALEDTKQRVRERLAKLLQGATPPKQLHIPVRWMKGNGNEFKELCRWLKELPGTKLIIIDTLVQFCSWKLGNYNADYQEISKFKTIADAHKIAIILVHHQRKTGATDMCERVSGSNGLFGAADTLVILDGQPFQDEATLKIISRDLRNTEIALKRDEKTGSWEVREQGAGDNMTPERQEIVKLLRESPRPWRLQEIAAALGKKKANVANLLASLTKQAIVTKVSYGKYQLKDGLGESCKAEGSSKKRGASG